MYDDDQRQALGQPSLDILMLKMIVVQEFLFLSTFLLSSFVFHLCNMLCMIMFRPIMPISFDVYSSKPANVWVNHCLSDLCTDCRFYNLFFFSSKKEIKSAGTEKYNVFVPVFSFSHYNILFRRATPHLRCFMYTL